MLYSAITDGTYGYFGTAYGAPSIVVKVELVPSIVDNWLLCNGTDISFNTWTDLSGILPDAGGGLVGTLPDIPPVSLGDTPVNYYIFGGTPT
jgi:hypothetical protein